MSVVSLLRGHIIANPEIIARLILNFFCNSNHSAIPIILAQNWPETLIFSVLRDQTLALNFLLFTMCNAAKQDLITNNQKKSLTFTQASGFLQRRVS
jgi:hypothetical protein